MRHLLVIEHKATVLHKAKQAKPERGKESGLGLKIEPEGSQDLMNHEGSTLSHRSFFAEAYKPSASLTI